jgi:hypothetical protein
MLKPLRQTFINRSYRDNTIRHNASLSARTYIRVHLRLLENAGHVIDFHRLHLRRATGNGALLDHRAHCPSRAASAASVVPEANAAMMSLHLTPSPRLSIPAHTPTSSSMAQAITAAAACACRQTSPSCRCRATRLNSTTPKSSGSNCARTSSPTPSLKGATT